MSTSTDLAERGRLLVTAAGARITVVDAFLDPVPDALGFGQLALDLPTGAYQVRARTAGVEETRTIVVRANHVREVQLRMGFTSAAPVSRALRFDHQHAWLAQEESSGFRHRTADPNLVVVVRGLPRSEVLRRRGAPPLQVWARGRAVSPTGQGLRDGPTGTAAAWQYRVPPRLCRLRWHHGSGHDIEHALWTSPGWKSMLFVHWTGRGPHLASMSVHLVPERRRWDPDGAEESAVEDALAALRDPAVTFRGASPGRGPMAVLLAQHQRLRAHGREAVQREAVAMLRVALTDQHPDVRVLADGLEPSPLPPMLSTSLERVLQRGMDPGRHAAWELLAGVAGQRLTGGPWLRWDALGLDAWKAYEGIAVTEQESAPPVIAVARVRDLLESTAVIRGVAPERVARDMSAQEMAERLGTTADLVLRALEVVLPATTGLSPLPSRTGESGPGLAGR